MTDAQIEAQFRRAFTTEVIRRIMVALRLAYDTASEHHVPDEGADEQTFGFCLSKYVAYQVFTQIQAYGDDCIVLEERRPRFRIKIGEFEVAPYRIGWSETDEVQNSFPSNDGAAGEMIEPQLWLPGVEKFQSLERARKVILGHMGNPEEGVRALYVCVPSKMKGDRIAEWSYVVPLWLANAVEDEILEPLAPEETASPPQIFFKEQHPERVDDDAGRLTTQSELAAEELSGPPALHFHEEADEKDR